MLSRRERPTRNLVGRLRNLKTPSKTRGRPRPVQVVCDPPANFDTQNRG